MIGVAAIVKNEGPYIDEWLAFHRLQGVSKFHIYDNGSTDDTLKNLQKHEDVYIIPWHVYPGQMSAYQDALQTFTDVKWIAFIDADEFLYSPTGKSLPEVLEKYDYASAVAVHWLLFGSSGHKKKSAEKVSVRFTKRANEVNPHVKSIVQTGRYAKVGPTVHAFNVDGGAVDELHRQLPYDYSVIPKGTADILAINHYHTKSKEEYEQKLKRRRADNGRLRRADSFEAHDVNEVEDLFVHNIMKDVQC